MSAHHDKRIVGFLTRSEVNRMGALGVRILDLLKQEFPAGPDLPHDGRPCDCKKNLSMALAVISGLHAAMSHSLGAIGASVESYPTPNDTKGLM